MSSRRFQMLLFQSIFPISMQNVTISIFKMKKPFIFTNIALLFHVQYFFMKIGFDAKRIFHNTTGLGNYSRSLVKNLAEYHPQYDIHLFTPKYKSHGFDFEAGHEFFIHTATSKPSWYWRTFKMTKDIERQNIDIYHGLTHELPRGIHRSSVKSVLTVHDLIFKIYPEQYKAIDRMIYDWKLQYACQAADKIIAISEQTKQDIIKYYQTPTDKIKVIYQTCNDIFLQKSPSNTIQSTLKKHQLPQDFLLCVGSIIERKNLLTLIKALPFVQQDIPLVIIGNGKAYKQKVEAYIQQHHLENKVIFLKNVATEDLPSLYQQAKIFIYPSLYEGFGIPIIEAIFSETPVITSQQSALPEAGGAFSTYIEGTNEKELAEKINLLLTNTNLVQTNVSQSLEWAKRQFHPVITAQQLHQVYLEVGSLS